MVKGLLVFRDHFRDCAGQYVVIGGTACDLLMDEAGLVFRSTKDLDIVLRVEALDAAFFRAFWEFVKSGEYQNQMTTSNERCYYRFSRPKNLEYPQQIELFANKPNSLALAPGAHLTPIPIDDEVSSLSAILLDDDYYSFMLLGRRLIEGIPIVDAGHLIPLKARAWLDMTMRKTEGASIDSKDIAKHKKDVFRLIQLIDPVSKIENPARIRLDMAAFLDAVESEPFDLESLGIKGMDFASALSELRRIYCPSTT